MVRQVCFFAFVSVAFAFFIRDLQLEFLDIRLRMKPAGEATARDYDSLSARFMLPRVALFALILMPVTIAGLFIEPKRKARPRVLVNRFCNWLAISKRDCSLSI